MSVRSIIRSPIRSVLTGALAGGASQSLASRASAIALAAGGALYDPSDLTSLYQSRTGGSTGATGQPVGIMLDKSYMGGRTAAAFIAGQAEKMPAASGLQTAIPAKSAYSNGRLTIAGATAGEAAATQVQAYDTVSGVTYHITATVNSIAGDSFTLLVNGGNVGQITGTGVKGPFVFTATATGTDVIRLIEWGGTLTDIDVTFSVKEIPGFHALAPSDAARPLLTVSGGLAYLTTDGVDDWMNVSPNFALGAQWWHVGGWRSDTTARRAFATSDDSNAALSHLNATMRWVWRADDATTWLDLTTGNPTSAHVLTVEQASASAMAARFNGGLSLGAVNPLYDATGQGLALFSGLNSSWLAGIAGRFYGGAFAPGTISTTDRATLEAYVAALSGVTL